MSIDVYAVGRFFLPRCLIKCSALPNLPSLVHAEREGVDERDARGESGDSKHQKAVRVRINGVCAPSVHDDAFFDINLHYIVFEDI